MQVALTLETGLLDAGPEATEGVDRYIAVRKAEWAKEVGRMEPNPPLALAMEQVRGAAPLSSLRTPLTHIVVPVHWA
jgi:hypothetical protein